MPFISYSSVAGALTPAQKQALSTALTEAVTQTLGEKLRPHIWVSLNEAPEGNFYIGGHALTASRLQTLISHPDAEQTAHSRESRDA